jgi:ubiquinone biosynthesis protein UbiJ
VLEKMSAFSGKVIKMEITGIDKELFLFPEAGGIQISTEYEGLADTTLRGSPFSLFKMGLAANAANLLLKGEVEIIGDTRLGHRFKNLFSQMDIDWSEPLADWFGDGIAYQLQQAGKKFGLWSKRSAESVSMTLSEYLQEESRDVVTETELQMFNDSVSRVRDDVDRLQAKIAQLSTAKTAE